MKIKVAKRAWHTATMNNKWQKFANHFAKHYPMDRQMAKYFREAMAATEDSAGKLKKSYSKTKSTTKRRTTAKKTTPKRRTMAKRTTAKRTAPKRRTAAKKTTAKRYTTKRWTASKRRSVKRRAA